MRRSTVIAFVIGIMLCVAGFCKPSTADTGEHSTITCFAGDTRIWSSNGPIPIENIVVGDRVVECGSAGVPDEKQYDSTVDSELEGPDGPAACPEQWREIELTLPKERGGQDLIQIRLLRTVSWLRQQESWPDPCGCSGKTAAQPIAAALEADDAQDLIGKRLHFVLPEMDATGWGTVRSIKPCPPIAPGKGQLVTATFRTPNQPLVEVRLVGQAGSIACTPGHPFLSVDRSQFVPAAGLADGETVATLTGTTVVESVELDPSRLANSHATVYNMEVGGVHRYAVGAAGAVVHNAGGCETSLYQKIGASEEHLKFGIANNPATRYTQAELAGGRLKIIATGSREQMLELERKLHETLPLGREEFQDIYETIQVRNGLLPRSRYPFSP